MLRIVARGGEGVAKAVITHTGFPVEQDLRSPRVRLETGLLAHRETSLGLLTAS